MKNTSLKKTFKTSVDMLGYVILNNKTNKENANYYRKNLLTRASKKKRN